MIFSIFIIFKIYTTYSQNKVFDAIVSADGTGDYMYIKSALNYNKKLIFIKNGKYKEKISIDASKSNIKLIGESKENVIITYDDYVGKNSSISTTYDTYTLKVCSKGFYAENITIENTATQAQAVALIVEADTVVFKNCIIKGFQDSHYAKSGRQFYYNCTIFGDVDFIFGNGTAYFENCTIVSRNRKPGYITAPGKPYIKTKKPDNTVLLHGFVFKNCILTYENGLFENSTYLGRPWEDSASSVFLNCVLDAHIKSEGWSVWTTDVTNDGFDNHLTSFFGEYKSVDRNNYLIDISKRVNWSIQLFDNDTFYYSVNYFLINWNPYKKIELVKPPSNIFFTNDSLYWEKIENARGYIVYRNDEIDAITTVNSLSLNGQTGLYKIKTVSINGSLSDFSWPFMVSKIVKNIKEKKYIIENNQIFLNDNAYISFYDITGRLISKCFTSSIYDVGFLKTGIYIIHFRFKDFETFEKIIVQ